MIINSDTIIALMYVSLVNFVVFGVTSDPPKADINVKQATTPYGLTIDVKPLPLPLPTPTPAPAPVFTSKQVDIVAKVVCGEVGPHREDTGRNVLQVIVNRAILKSERLKTRIQDQIVDEATRRVQGVPQFATVCRPDNRAEWQHTIVREALSGDSTISSAPWMSKKTLWFRTHTGAHLWEKGKGWTRNLSRAGVDHYHTFFDANTKAMRLMARY